MAEKIEPPGDLSTSPLYNADIAPTPLEKRTWNLWHIAALWIGMAVCIPTYMLGAGLLQAGMTWWQAVLTITLGNLIVLVPMALNAHAGTRYGIPFPVFLRAPFGTIGSNIPALMRAAVACGWFGIQTWIGGKACYLLAAVLEPSIAKAAPIAILGINGWQLLFFLLFWATNLYFILKGTESIKWLEAWSAPLLLAVGLGLLAWGFAVGGGPGRVLGHSRNFANPTLRAWRDGDRIRLDVRTVQVQAHPRVQGFRMATSERALADADWYPVDPTHVDALSLPGHAPEVWVELRGRDPNHVAKVKAQVASGAPSDGTSFWTLFFPMLTAMVGFWATLALNIPDFTRFAKSQRDQALGQFIGLPTTMGLYSFIGIATTCAALVYFPDILVTEQAPWDPVALLSRFENPLLVIVSMIFMVIATLTTNIAANVVSPANDLSNLAPRHISFKMGGLITAVIGILMMPWKLLERPDVYIFNWLISYSALLGPIAGIMIADYWVVRRRELAVGDLYRTDGRYGVVNWGTVAVLALAILPNVPGFLANIGVAGIPAFWSALFRFAWFVGFAIAFALYSGYGLWRRTATSSTASG